MSTVDIFVPDQRVHLKWTSFEQEAVIQCHAILCPDESGGFSAHCANLPGVVSQGDTEQEAIGNIADCFRETIAYYRSAGETIPWGEVEIDRPVGFLERWIEVRM